MRSERKKSDSRSRAFHGADEWSRKAGKLRRASQMDEEFRTREGTDWEDW